MSRRSRRRSLTIVATTLAALVTPAAAHAATYTVKAGDGPCNAPADTACGSLSEAATAASPNDVFNVSPGTYPAVEFTDGGVTINGAAGVAIDGTMKFTGDTGGAVKMSKVALSQGTGSAPGIIVSGAAGLQLSDAAILSLNGHGIIFSAGTANKIVRAVILTGGAQTSAVQIESPAGSAAKALTVESAVLSGGAAGIGAFTKANALEAGPGDITITARHLTAAGSTNGLKLDSSQATGIGAVGNIAATLTDSIALNNQASNYPGILGVGANTATITATRSMQTGDPKALFADAAARNFRLRPGSPAIDQGGFTTGESPTDVDGEPRPGPTTDLGGDEFFNAAPIAKIAVATAKPRAGQPVILDGSASTDREAGYGGGIVSYRWTFGDGATETTTTPQVAHTYKNEGTAVAQLVVVDRQGAESVAATVPVALGDGIPPEATITKPFARQKIKLVTTKITTVTTKGVKRKVKSTKRTKIGFAGVAKDKSGIGFVLLTIEKLPTVAPRCTWFDAKRGLIKRSCAKPVLLVAKVNAEGLWTFNISTKVKQPSAGNYRVSVYAADKSGAFGNSARERDRIIRFTLQKR